VPLFYKQVRHPLYVGWMIAFWATPAMTWGHLLFAAVLTGYMALAALIEERDLIAHFGNQYQEYRRRVPMFVPRLRPNATSVPLPLRTATPVSLQADGTPTHLEPHARSASQESTTLFPVTMGDR
jgi:hypothetical protein